MICPLKAETFWRIFCCKPIPVATETIIIIIPNAMAMMAIFIIGAEILLLWSRAVMSLFAMKYSKFNSNYGIKLQSWIASLESKLRF